MTKWAGISQRRASSACLGATLPASHGPPASCLRSLPRRRRVSWSTRGAARPSGAWPKGQGRGHGLVSNSVSQSQLSSLRGERLCCRFVACEKNAHGHGMGAPAEPRDSVGEEGACPFPPGTTLQFQRRTSAPASLGSPSTGLSPSPPRGLWSGP